MTARPPSSGDPPPPLVDADERAETEWLLARDRDPHAPPPSAEIASDYAQLEHLLTTLPTAVDDERWQDEVLAAARAPAPQEVASDRPAASTTRMRPRRWALIGGAVAAAAAVALFAVTRPGPVPELIVTTREATLVRGTEVAVGHHLIVRVRSRRHAELRVYRGHDALLLRCPGADCAERDGGWQVELELGSPGLHYVLLVVGDLDAAPDLSMDDYLSAARTAGVRVIVHPAIDVR